MIDINSLEDLVGLLLNENKILIYGAGYIGDHLFYNGLNKQGLDHNVVSFVTTTGSNKKVDGLDVKCIDDISPSDDYLICIAVHDSVLKAIVDTLNKRGFTKYIWITPYRFQILLGEPVEAGIEVPLKSIWNAERNRISIPSRLLAAEEYYGKNKCGYDIYRHHLNLFEKSEKTSQHRLDSFIGLIHSFEQIGMNRAKRVAITQNGDIIDGAHRVSLALWYGYDTICCDVYDVGNDYREIHSEIATPDIEKASELGFNKQEIKEIKRIRDMIDEQMEK